MEESLAVRSVDRTVEEVLLPAIELAEGREAREAEWELACRWATGWLYAARRVVPPASRAQGVLLFDSSERLDHESLHVQGLELAIRRAGFRTLLLSFDLPPERITRAMRAVDPTAFVFCGGEATLEVLGQARLHGAPGRLGGARVRVPRGDAGHGRPRHPVAGLDAHRGGRAAQGVRRHRPAGAGCAAAVRGRGRRSQAARPASGSPLSAERSPRTADRSAPAPTIARRWPRSSSATRSRTGRCRRCCAPRPPCGASSPPTSSVRACRPPGFSALVVLTTAGGSLELRALRRRLGWSKAGATEVTVTLESRGLVARRRLAHDRRAAAVDLLPAGRSLVERLFPGHADRVSSAFSALDEDEKRSLAEICRKLAA